MHYAARTHIGLVRQINEDSYAVDAELTPFGVAVVADGMGGHLAGEVASSLAIETVVSHINEALRGAESYDASDLIVDAMQLANRVVFERASTSEGLSGMGTTLVTALLNSEEIYLGHIGDSRAYLFADGELLQLTDDHTLVNELYKNGQLTAEEACVHPQRNIVTRSVGSFETVQADLYHRTWGEGNILLICSDGLTNMVKEEAMIQIFAADLSLEAMVDAMIDQALAAGGHDNITVVAVQNRAERGDAL
ncbi:serine/threonine protein phosphatase [Tumebacillus algifaecis]|uniref:Serine/threonine protein phosphatase n=2 Tax=Tumebacillus algifaecis TaxID=1214604 RepID=A0A223D6M0_9BACL|nr:serine/threonine protein phosphatase [Tumebacillus algifaecis]